MAMELKWEKSEEHTFDSERFQLRVSLGRRAGFVEFVEKGTGAVAWSGDYEKFLEWSQLAKYAHARLENDQPVNRDIGLYAPGTK